MTHYGYITMQEDSEPRKRHLWYLLTAILDSISLAFITHGGKYTPSDWQTGIQQLKFPLTFILAPICFKSTRDYMKLSPYWTVLSIIGASLLITGIIITIFPDIKTTDYQTFGVMTFASSVVLSSCSFLIKEWYLQYRKDEQGLTIPASAVRLNFWNAIYMIPITFLLWPLHSISTYGGLPLKELPDYLAYGFQCCFIKGYNSTVDVPGSSCNGAWISELIFSVGTFVAGIFALVLVKEGSAAFQWAANILVVPVSGLIFSLQFLPIPMNFRKELTWEISVGCALVILGILVYGIGELKGKNKVQSHYKRLSIGRK